MIKEGKWPFDMRCDYCQQPIVYVRETIVALGKNLHHLCWEQMKRSDNKA